MAKFSIGKFSKARAAGHSKAAAKQIASGGRATNPRKKRRTKKRRTTKRRRNSWKGNTAGHRKAAKKGVRRVQRRRAKRRVAARRRRRNPATRTANPTSSTSTRTSRSNSVKVVKVPGATKVVRVGSRQANPVRRRRKNPKRRNPSRRRKNPSRAITRSRNSGGALDGLFSNPAGPFTVKSLKSFGSAAFGLGLGLTGADVLDRYIATRTPTDGVRPWYGRDAAAAQHRRPDAYRLGGQAALALAAMAATYFTRRGRYLPWFFGGTAVGAGANLAKMVIDWWVAPLVFKVDNPSEESLANRLFPTEQTEVQDQIDAFFENWQANPSLAEAQSETAPVIQSPLGSGSAYTLGKTANGGRGPLFLTGKLGKCDSCGGDGGCFGSCKDYCPPCADNVGVSAGAAVQQAPQCDYTVRQGDNFGAIAALAGVSPDVVSALNGGGSPETFWTVGSQVRLPYALCKHLEGAGPKPGSVAGSNGADAADKPVVPPPVSIETGPTAAEAEARAMNFGNEDPAE